MSWRAVCFETVNDIIFYLVEKEKVSGAPVLPNRIGDGGDSFLT